MSMSPLSCVCERMHACVLQSFSYLRCLRWGESVPHCEHGMICEEMYIAAEFAQLTSTPP